MQIVALCEILLNYMLVLNFVTDEKFIDSLIEILDLIKDRCINEYVIVGKFSQYRYIKKRNT